MPHGCFAHIDDRCCFICASDLCWCLSLDRMNWSVLTDPKVKMVLMKGRIASGVKTVEKFWGVTVSHTCPNDFCPKKCSSIVIQFLKIGFGK